MKCSSDMNKDGESLTEHITFVDPASVKKVHRFEISPEYELDNIIYRFQKMRKSMNNQFMNEPSAH